MRYLLPLFLIFLLSAFACSRREVASTDWTPYIGLVTSASDTRLSLWVPEGAEHRARGPLRLQVAAGGSCAATLKLGSTEVSLAADGGWSPVQSPAGRFTITARSACGAGAAVELSSLLPGVEPEVRRLIPAALGGAGPATPGSQTGPPSRPPLVLITIDTLRPDFLGAYGDAGGLSPHLDAFARTGTLYLRARTHSPWTGPSMAALMTGRQSAGLEFMAEVPSTLPTVAEQLMSAGYRTVAAVNNPRLAAETGMARGFHRFCEFAEDEPLVDAVSDLVGGDEPVFLWAHLLGPHLPLDPSADDLVAAGWEPSLGEPFYQEDDSIKPDTSFTEQQRRRVRALYRADIHHADRNFGRLLQNIDRLLPEATIIVSSDHGEELWEHGAHGHGHAFWRELLAVPLIVRSGELPRGSRRELVRLCDLGPTLLRAARIALPASMECRPLQEEGERWSNAGNPLHGPKRVTLESPAWKLLREERGPAQALFDVAQDPAEAVDVRKGQPELVSALEHLSRAFVNSARPPPGSSRVVLTLTGLTLSPARVTLRSASPLELLPLRPPGRWGMVNRDEGGRRWTIHSPGRSDAGGEGAVLEIAFAATAPVSAEVEVAGKTLPSSAWFIAGAPAGDTRTIRPDQEGWRSDSPPAKEPRVDLWMQPRGEPPLRTLFTPEQQARLRAIGYAL